MYYTPHVVHTPLPPGKSYNFGFPHIPKLGARAKDLTFRAANWTPKAKQLAFYQIDPGTAYTFIPLFADCIKRIDHAYHLPITVVAESYPSAVEKLLHLLRHRVNKRFRTWFPSPHPLSNSTLELVALHPSAFITYHFDRADPNPRKTMIEKRIHAYRRHIDADLLLS